ncbi:MAG: GPMC system MBL fold metallohydrolase [Deltaproteobacteria bacterium]
MSPLTTGTTITILGSGTSTGVPLIGCDCDVCTSTDLRNKRTRCSILISGREGNILVDTSTDLRFQALSNNINRISAVLFTHAHADHIHGIDELRSFNFIQKERIPCYGDRKTVDKITAMFSYIFERTWKGGGIPRLDMNSVEAGDFTVLGKTIKAVPVMHGDLQIFGYRFGPFAYVTDCSGIPPESMKELEGLDLLILGALRYSPHTTHFSVQQALEVVRSLRPRRTILTHMGHEIEYEKASRELPEGVEPGYDGMRIDLK